MSVEQQATRVASGAKSALKALIQKLGGTVPDSTKIDGYADIVDAMTLAAMKPSSHASTHKTGGSDAIAPADIGAAASSHTHTKANITDFPTSMTPTAHKASHKTGGTDAIAPADIGAVATTDMYEYTADDFTALWNATTATLDEFEVSGHYTDPDTRRIVGFSATYQFEVGMTWQEFVNSNYATSPLMFSNNLTWSIVNNTIGLDIDGVAGGDLYPEYRPTHRVSSAVSYNVNAV